MKITSWQTLLTAYGLKTAVAEAKWFYFALIAGATILGIIIVLLLYIFVVLPLSSFIGGTVATYVVLMFYAVFLFVPAGRDFKKLKLIMGCDHKLLLGLFGAFTIMDAMKFLDNTTSTTMVVVYFLLIIHSLKDAFIT
jgi:hypothetical protein